MEVSRLGRYQLVGELGKGAMGVVYRARDPMLDRTVAIKTINMALELEERSEYEARFYQEAKAAGSLNHPNIVTIYDIGKAGHVVYMAMELLEGKELRALMAPGRPMPIGSAVNVAAQVADGLGYAHEHDVVHRDVKPANIMIVRDGRVKITDFGIAHMRSTNIRTQTGAVLGSPKYLSPEQVAGKRAEPSSDIFALGVILYEMVTGKAPFNGEDVTGVMFQILNFVPPPPSSLNREAPEMLDFIVAKALAKSPQKRYADIREMARDLRECAKQVGQAEQIAAPLAAKPARTSFDPEPAADLLVRPVPKTRREDAEPDPLEPSVALGVSRAFNSLDATMRLAAQTGMAREMEAFANTMGGQIDTEMTSTTQRTSAFPLAHQYGWNRQDRLIFAAGIVCAILIGAMIVFA
ncbi:MAG TPA: serine/threonine-protein kinase [Burkholderiales bacterium]|nr:serine/threonine-protein kinase [Burkholderiales bacterium]